MNFKKYSDKAAYIRLEVFGTTLKNFSITTVMSVSRKLFFHKADYNNWSNSVLYTRNEHYFQGKICCSYKVFPLEWHLNHLRSAVLFIFKQNWRFITVNKGNERVAGKKVNNLGDMVSRPQQVELTCDIVAVVNKLQQSIMKLINFR